jgi:hypothetical protein
LVGEYWINDICGKPISIALIETEGYLGREEQGEVNDMAI